MLNEYYDGRTDAVGRVDLPDASLRWLERDLAETRQSLIWVLGHKPIASLPKGPATPRWEIAAGSLTEALLDAIHRNRLIKGLPPFKKASRVQGLYRLGTA